MWCWVSVVCAALVCGGVSGSRSQQQIGMMDATSSTSSSGAFAAEWSASEPLVGAAAARLALVLQVQGSFEVLTGPTLTAAAGSSDSKASVGKSQRRYTTSHRTTACSKHTALASLRHSPAPLLALSPPPATAVRLSLNKHPHLMTTHRCHAVPHRQGRQRSSCHHRVSQQGRPQGGSAGLCGGQPCASL